MTLRSGADVRWVHGCSGGTAVSVGSAPADRWRTPDAGDDDPTKAASDAPEPEDDPEQDDVDDRREIPRDLHVPHLPEAHAGDPPRVGEDGSWEWKGHRLEAPDNTLAEQGIERRRQGEPAITHDLRTTEADLADSRLEGCPEHTLKGPDRFKEKLASQIEARPNRSPAELEREIHDGIRYTFSIDDAGYTAGVWRVHDRLTELGYDLEQRDNNWENPAFKGINSRWVEPHTGELVEVQFHTPTSWRINKTTHDAYEEIENPTTDPSRVAHLRAWRRQVVAAIPTPPGASDIPDFRKDQQ